MVASISPTLRSALAARGVDHVGERAPRGRQALVEADAGRGHERDGEVQLGEELHRPAPGEHPHVLVELAGADDHVDRVRLDLVGDRGGVGDERQLVRRVLDEPARERQGGRGRVEEDGRAVADVARGVRGDRGLGGAGLVGALRPRRRDRRRARRQRERPRPAVHPLDQALARELLEVAVDRDRGDGVVAREVGDGHAAVALDALEDLRSAKCGGHGVQTRSTNSLRVTETSSGRNSSIARTRWSA